MIAAVVMDLDATLIESTDLWRAALRDSAGAGDEVAVYESATDYVLHRADRLTPVPGAEALVHAVAAHVPVVVATTAAARYAAVLTDLMPGLFEPVSSIVVGDFAERHTPLDLHQTVLESLGMAPDNVVALLNSTSALLDACTLGMRAIGVPHPSRPLPRELAGVGIPVSPTLHHAAVRLLRMFRTEGVIPPRWRLGKQLLAV